MFDKDAQRIRALAKTFPAAFGQITNELGFGLSNAEAVAKARAEAEEKWRATLRDQFAMKALAGLCAADDTRVPAVVAEQAYRLADAMLEARK